MNNRTARLQALDRQIARLNQRGKTLKDESDQFSRWRLGAFFGGIGAALIGFSVQTALGVAVTFLTLGLFTAIVLAHGRLRRAQAQFNAMETIKREQRARMTLDWRSLPPNIASAEGSHPFASDIDIVGDYSLHRLMDTAVSLGGSERLLMWLLQRQPNPQTIAERQARLRELIPLKTFRERLRVKARLATERPQRGKWDGRHLISWLEANADTNKVSPLILLLLIGLAVTNIVLFVLSSAGLLPALWPISFVIYIAISGWQWSRLGDMFGQALVLQNALTQLRAVFAHLENTPIPAEKLPHLNNLLAPFRTGEKPSGQLRRVAVVVTAASIQRNPALWIVLNFFVPWDVFFAYLLGRTRGDLARLLPPWLDVWYEVEALNALAEFAYLNPHYTFPDVVDGAHSLHAAQLGHPLIPAEEKVCNDFSLDGLGQVVVVTGSNMSGKSSFLRTVGLNMVLAYAGSVVNADSLQIGTFRLFSCIRVTDSVVDGISYFYAEVKRLKALLDATQSDDAYPLFFLIDEIFRGTNNRERLIGSESFIRALVGRESLGLISTHDLELVRLADLIPQIRNFHFREHIESDRMAFDYLLREGPSPTTNALKIMMIEGLPVDESLL